MTLFVNCLNNLFVRKSVKTLVWRCVTVTNFSPSRPTIKNEKSSQNSFIKVYELPKIKAFRIINRFKLYHTALTAFAIPFSLYINSNIDMQVITVAAIGFGGCLAFYGSGRFLNNLIGAVYINKTADTVMLSYIDFWGKRMDRICPVSDIVPLSNQPLGKNLFKLSTIQFSSSSQSLLLASEHGDILLPHAFDEVFFRVTSNIQKQNTHPQLSSSKETVKSQ